MYLPEPLKKHFQNLFDTLYPYRCILCSEQILSSELCATCWNTLTFIHEPICYKCGLPLIFKNQEHECELSFVQSRFILTYNERSKPLFMKFKYFDVTTLADVFAKWIINLIPPQDPFWCQIQTLVPVPLHRFRLLKRQYNQSALLCQELKKHLPHLSIDYNVLKRKKMTVSQGKLLHHQRVENLKDAFYVSKDIPKGILLVDDVWASGATLKACAKTLKKPIKVLCVARSIAI